MTERTLLQSTHEALLDRGWHMLKDADREVFDAVTTGLANTLYDSDVRLDPKYPHRVTKPFAIPYHCDSPRAHLIGWMCVSSGKRRVPLKLVDALQVARDLDPKTTRLLAETRLGFNCRISERLCSMPILSDTTLDDDTLAFFNPWNIPKNLSEAQRHAFATYQRALNETPPIEVDFSDGDILIVNNHRIVHGRDALDEDTDRHLLRRLMEDPAIRLPIKEVRQSNVVKVH